MGAWFTEAAWPPIIVLATAAGAGIVLFFSSQRIKYLAAVLPFVILTPVIYIVEQRIVTERERVEAAILEVVAAFERNDQPQVLKHFSANRLALRANVMLGMSIAQATGSIRVTDVSVALQNEESRAVTHLRANGPVRARDYGDVGHRPSRWELTWQKEGGNWRIVDLQRLDPITGEPMFLLETSERARGNPAVDRRS